MLEKGLPKFNQYLSELYKPYSKESEKKCIQLSKDLLGYDQDRGTDEKLILQAKSYFSAQIQKYSNRADLRNADIEVELKKLLEKYINGGEYSNKFQNLAREYGVLAHKLSDDFEKLINSEVFKKDFFVHLTWYSKQCAHYANGISEGILPTYKKQIRKLKLK